MDVIEELLNALAVPVCMIDAENGIILYDNEMFRSMCGFYLRDSMYGIKQNELFTKDIREQGNIRCGLKTADHSILKIEADVKLYIHGRKKAYTACIKNMDARKEQRIEPAGSAEHIEKVKLPIFQGEILICEDDVAGQLVASRHLLKIGIRSEVAINGKHALEMVLKKQEQNQFYDLILMSENMPIMGGFETVGKIREQGIVTPVLLMTIGHEREENGIQYGITGYFKKTYILKELADELLKYLVPVRYEIFELSSSRKTEKEEVLDYQLGLSYADGNEELYQILLRNFSVNYKDFCPAVNKLIAEGDIMNTYRMVHNLKITAGMIGAEGVRLAAYQIENALEEGINLCSRNQMDELERKLDAVFERLLEFVLEEKQALIQKKNKRLNKRFALDLIYELEPLLKFGNTAGLDLIEDIKRILAPLEEHTSTLIRYMQDFDFEEAFALLVKIKEELSQEGINE